MLNRIRGLLLLLRNFLGSVLKNCCEYEVWLSFKELLRVYLEFQTGVRKLLGLLMLLRIWLLEKLTKEGDNPHKYGH